MMWGITAALALIVAYMLWRHFNAPERRLKRRVMKKRVQVMEKATPPQHFNARSFYTPPWRLTVKEAEEQYGVSGRTLRRWLQQHKITGWKNGRIWVIDRQSLEKYLEERQ